MPDDIEVNRLEDRSLAAGEALAAIADDNAWPAHLLAQSLAHSNGRCWVARHRHDGRLMGFCLLSVGPFDAEIEMIAVTPACRRQGVARALMHAATVAMANEGKERLLLEVRASNQAAISLYQAQGFKWDGRRRHYYPVVTKDPASGEMEREDAWLFSRQLG